MHEINKCHQRVIKGNHLRNSSLVPESAISCTCKNNDRIGLGRLGFIADFMLDAIQASLGLKHVVEQGCLALHGQCREVDVSVIVAILADQSYKLIYLCIVPRSDYEYPTPRIG